MMGRVVGLVMIVLGLAGLGASLVDQSVIETFLPSPAEGPELVAASDRQNGAVSEAVPETDGPSDPGKGEGDEIRSGNDEAVAGPVDAGSASVDIFGDEAKAAPETLPRVAVTTGADGTTEDSDHVKFILKLSEPADHPIIIIFTTVDGSARSAEDYESQRGTVTFRPGIVSAEIRTPLIDDELKEGDEQFSLVLNGDPGIVTLESRRTLATIRDDD